MTTKFEGQLVEGQRVRLLTTVPGIASDAIGVVGRHGNGRLISTVVAGEVYRVGFGEGDTRRWVQVPRRWLAVVTENEEAA